MSTGDAGDTDQALEREALEPIREELDRLRERHAASPSIDLLRAARADALPPDLQAAVSAHLDRDRWSRALADDLDAIDGTESAAPLDDVTHARMLQRIRREAGAGGATATTARRRRWPTVLAAAAAAILAVVVIRQSRPAPPQTAAVAPTTSAVPSERPEPSTSRLPLDKPAVKFTAMALVLRGDRDAAFVDDVAPAISAYRADDYARAAQAFAAIAPRYPKSVEVPFYLGVSRLFTNDGPGAISALESARALADDTFAPDAAWYLAVAYERAGRNADARRELESLCAGQSSYAARACDAASRVGTR